MTPTTGLLKASMYMAFFGGIVVPALETYRRWHQMDDWNYFISWFDDYLIGGFLLWAAWKTYRSPATGQQYLCAAWGIATGMAFMSFFGQLQKIHLPDPSGVPTTTVVIIKGIMFLLSLLAMIFALRPSSSK